MSINKGDKVLFKNYLGVVRLVDSDNLYAIEFGDDFGVGHNCLGAIRSGKGWWCRRDDLKLLETAIVKTKQDLIIDKIKYLDKKFEERYKNEYPF